MRDYPFGYRICMAVIGVWAFGPGVCSAETGHWQGRRAEATQVESASSSRLLVLDTGGSGGGFGRGDVRQALHDVHFWDGRRGWTCGYGGVFSTTDGGLTWIRRKPRGGWYHVEMSGPEEVWLLEGFHGQGKACLWHSTDDGQTWQEVLAGQLRGYTDLYCRGSQRWVLCGGFPSYHSDDSGATWHREGFGGLSQANRVAIPGDVLQGGGLTVYVLGSHQQKRRLVKSADGGRTWSTVAIPEWDPKSMHRDRIFFASSWQGWIAGEGGNCYATADGGATWTASPVPGNRAVTALWFDTVGRGFAAVANNTLDAPAEALFSSRDGGKTWQSVLGGRKHIDAIFGLSPRQVWMVGNVPNYVPNDLVVIGEVER